MCQANISTTGNFQESNKWMISFADLSMFCLKSPVFLLLMGQSYLALFLKSTNCFTTERYVLTSSSSTNRKKISSSMVYSMVSRKEASLLKGKENLVAWERRRKRIEERGPLMELTALLTLLSQPSQSILTLISTV